MGVGRSWSRSLLCAGAVSLGALGCSGASRPPAAAPRRVPSTAPAIAPEPRIAWTQLRNPIVSSADHAVKDAALVAVNGKWVMAFSAVDAHGTWRIGLEQSSDLRTWSPMRNMPHDAAVDGEASPDVVRAPDGRYVVTYQSFVHDTHGGLAKLYYRTTSDFVRFSPPQRLLQPLFAEPTDRLIDAALAWTPAGLLLGFKTGNTDSTQAFEIARSTTGSLSGPWQLVGKPDIRVFGDTIENYQFIEIQGRWKLLATSNLFDRPFLFNLVGNAQEPRGWLRWSAGRQLVIRQEAWNSGTGITGSTYEHANSVYLVDRRAVDGYFYAVYEDAPEMTRFGREGHGQLSVARSADLVRWFVPPA